MILFENKSQCCLVLMPPSDAAAVVSLLVVLGVLLRGCSCRRAPLLLLLPAARVLLRCGFAAPVSLLLVSLCVYFHIVSPLLLLLCSAVVSCKLMWWLF
jgi:hypothetical protein